MAVLLSGVFGFAGERLVDRANLIPHGLLWSFGVYLLCAGIAFVVIVAVLTKLGR
jgi:hypothetical protein